TIRSELQKPALGYYGAFVDSELHRTAEPKNLKSISELTPNWFDFHTQPLIELDSKESSIFVTTFSPSSSKKIGMNPSRIVAGENKTTRSARKILEFFSVHLYAINPTVSSLFLSFLLTSLNFEKKIETSETISLAFLIVSLELAYSHYLDTFFYVS